MKKITSLFAILILLMVPNQIQAKINYIESKENETTNATQVITDSDEVDTINQAEGLSSEQIIIQITDEGFVSSHGDHYHYYNGEVPYDGIFSEKLLVASDYQLNEKEIVREIERGFVVKVNDQYQLYFDNLEQVTSIRTDDEVMLQANDVHPKDAKNINLLKEAYQLPEAKIMVASDKTESEILKEAATDESLVVYLLEQGYVSLINQTFYLFNQPVARSALFSSQLLVDENYQLDSKEIVQEIDNGKIIKSNNHYYIYLEDPNNAENIKSNSQ